MDVEAWSRVDGASTASRCGDGARLNKTKGRRATHAFSMGSVAFFMSALARFLAASRSSRILGKMPLLVWAVTKWCTPSTHCGDGL